MIFCIKQPFIANFFKNLQKRKKSIDFSKCICYNIVVVKIVTATSWRDGRVGLRRTTGNRVYPNRYHGFESHSLRQYRKSTQSGAFSVLVENTDTNPSAIRRSGSHTANAVSGVLRGYWHTSTLAYDFANIIRTLAVSH